MFLARAVPVSDEGGKIIRWLGNSIDLHEDRLAEGNRRQAEKLMAAARCATSVAHQINNPLSAATNAIYLAQQDTTLSETTRSYLDSAAAQVARVAHVTAGSLGFHKQTGTQRQVDIATVLDSVLAFFEPRLLEHGLTLQREITPVPPLRCYRDDVSQAISAVLINAVQASSRGGVLRVRLSHRGAHHAGEPRRVRITVADCGTGVAESIREELFRPFVSTKGESSAGLGLWMCHEIMRRHGGSIHFRTRTAKPGGTVFVLCFPIPINS